MSLIPNNDKVGYWLYFAMMCAIKRSVADHINGNDNSGLELFLNWASKYSRYNQNESTQAYNYIDTKKNKCYGFPTLLLIASYCCPALKTKQYYIDRLKVQRIPDKVINEEYIKITDYLQNDTRTLFVKSPMGSGKTYDIHNIPKEASCVFLSCRRAYANCMSSDFKESGFVNYLDEQFTGNEERIIISLESIRHLDWDSYDYLIIDESESIFNIISSQTLCKNEETFMENIATFERLIRDCKKVIVMDAFLSERSIIPLEKIRGDIRSYFVLNEYKHPERTATFVNKHQLVGEIIDKLNKKERCVFVCVGVARMPNGR